MQESEKTVASLQAELALLRKQRTVDTVASVLSTATGFGALIVIAYLLNRTLEALPEDATAADIVAVVGALVADLLVLPAWIRALAGGSSAEVES